MAREIEVWHKHTLNQGDRPEHRVSKHQFVSVTGNNHSTGDTQAIGTAIETIALPSDSTPAKAIYVENLDDTNFVLVGATSAVGDLMPIKLWGKSAAGPSWGFIPWVGSQITASADTAAIDLYYEIYEA